LNTLISKIKKFNPLYCGDTYRNNHIKKAVPLGGARISTCGLRIRSAGFYKFKKHFNYKELIPKLLFYLLLVSIKIVWQLPHLLDIVR
jgi:hypothetical protein